jgi:hypothetical protein
MEKKFKQKKHLITMKNLIKIIGISVLGLGSLTSCVSYNSGYATNDYSEGYYNNGYYYAPDNYYGNGGYYGNDGYYYRDNIYYQYDNGIPYYLGQNNQRIYIVKQNNATSTNSNPATFGSANNGNNNTNGNIRNQNTTTRSFGNSSATPRTQNNSNNTAPRRTNSQGGFRNTAPQNTTTEKPVTTQPVRSGSSNDGMRGSGRR